MQNIVSLFTTYLPYFVLVLTLLVFVQSLAPDQRRRAFFTQPLYARAAVVLGGPAANLIFAVLLLTGVFYAAGEPYSPAIIAVQVDGPAARAGLQTGDEVVRLVGKRIDRYEDIQDAQFLYWAKPMAVEYRRDGKLMTSEQAKWQKVVNDAGIKAE